MAGFPKAGATYAFKADNGKYLTNVDTYIQPSAQSTNDVSSKFLCILIEGNKVAFQGDGGTGPYLSMIYSDANYIQAIKPEIDLFSQFTYEKEGVHVYLKAANGEYWTGKYEGDKETIETSPEKTASSRFTVYEL